MRVIRHHEDLPEELRGAVAAIGNFDGIHRGHHAVIGKAGSLAAEVEAPHAVITFEPHPRAYFLPKTPPFRLTPFRTKTTLIEALGVDLLIVLTFDAALAGMSAKAFATEVLGQGLGLRHVVVGDDFAFGAKRGGDVKLLRELGRGLGFGVSALGQVAGQGDEAYSSTRVREYLAAGNPTRAALQLGRYYEIEGRVQGGDKRGRDLGYPTANIALGDILLPAFGVYAIRAGIERGGGVQWHDGVANLGIRPMFESPEPLLEAHLFDFQGDLYGDHLRVALVDYLRPELSFDGLAALKDQMDEDARRARVILTHEEWESSWPSSPFGADGGG